MSSVAPIADTVSSARPGTGLAAVVEHTRYVLGENRVTAFAFALLLVILIASCVVWMWRSSASGCRC